MIISMGILICISEMLSGQVEPVQVANQKDLLRSEDPMLAANKKLVYDMWRIVVEGGHLDLAEKFMKESYIQHNPNAANGRQGFIDFFSKFTTPQQVVDTIKWNLFAIVAEGDLVTLCFNRMLPDPSDSTKTYHTTWFDMFRIEDGKVAEHWDPAEKR
jgi:predicted SnoaL-like aldol condensation-catalyzing enzyme